jgi:NAD-dependent DNA ligase
VSQLKSASHAYYETGEPIIDDDTYDALVDELRALDPSNPYLSAVGAPVSEGAVRLPIPMPSLRKVKPDSGLDTWTKAYPGPWVASDKLDGISALWIPDKGALYLRGNGLVGQDVSHLVGLGIQGLVKPKKDSVMVRGELIVPKGSVSGTLARSWVNGQLHQKNPSKADISRIQFLAYTLYSGKGQKRSAQLSWLKEASFLTVPYSIIGDASQFAPLLMERRERGLYDIDGLVVAPADAEPEGLDLRATLPRDAVAFKMALADQKAQTTVVAVHWASSMGGLWIPRIEVKPVTIGSATITYATGHNARFIKEYAIGPGAVIVLRRSGDVIPTVEAVVRGAPGGAAMPCGSAEPRADCWVWDERGTHAVDARGVVDTEKLALFMVDSLNAFDIDGVSSKNAAKLVEGGLKDLSALWKAGQGELAAIVGTALGVKLYTQLHEKLPVAEAEQWIAAYQGWPRGFGKSRIRALLERGPVETWKGERAPPKGIGIDTYNDIIGCVDGFLSWKAGFGLGGEKRVVKLRIKPKNASDGSTLTAAQRQEMSKKEESVAASAQVLVQTPQQKRGAFVFTGFRDKDLEKRLTAAGWTAHDSVKKDTTVLIVADESKMGSTKVAEAEKKGIRIILRTQAQTLL